MSPSIHLFLNDMEIVCENDAKWFVSNISKLVFRNLYVDKHEKWNINLNSIEMKWIHLEFSCCFGICCVKVCVCVCAHIWMWMESNRVCQSYWAKECKVYTCVFCLWAIVDANLQMKYLKYTHTHSSQKIRNKLQSIFEFRKFSKNFSFRSTNFTSCNFHFHVFRFS